MLKFPKKIAVIGNACGGKTRLSRRLSELYQIPVTHVDSFQFLPGMKLRDLQETRNWLKSACELDEWIVDGYGPLDVLEDRLRVAEAIVFIDLPLRIHYWWACKRVLQNFFRRRSELPVGCSELNREHILKLFKTIHRIHYKMRPEMLRILARPEFLNKTFQLKSKSAVNQFYRHGVLQT